MSCLSSPEVKKMSIWLTPLNYRPIWMDAIKKRAPGTCIWFVDGDKYKSWVNTAGAMLCGVGLPGAGKTTLSSIVIEHLQKVVKGSNPAHCVAFVFFRHTDRVTVRDVLASIVRQMVEDHTPIFALVKPIHGIHDLHGTQMSEEECLDVLRQASQMLARCFISLDAFDEAPKEVQLQILHILSSLNVNLLVTSRPSALPSEIVPRATVVEIVADNNDIKILIDETIRRNFEFRDLLRNQSGQLDWERRIISTVQEKSRGMFLLAALQLELLQGCVNTHELRETLDGMPEGVKEMYRRTIKRIQGQPMNSFLLAQRIFVWLLHAKRSLRVSELQTAVAICSKSYKLDKDRIVHQEDRLVAVCCGLIAINRDRVGLIHYTTYDALKELFPLGVGHPHSFIASACTQLLLDHQCHNYPGKDEYPYQLRNLLAPHPLLEYSYTNWPAHAKESEQIPDAVITFIDQCDRYPVIFRHKEIDLLQSIHVAAWYRFQDRRFLTPFIVNIPTKRGRTALILASYNGDVSAVGFLLSAPGINVNARDRDGNTSLIWASARGHEGVVRLLLQARMIDVDAKGQHGDTALIKASESSHESIVRLLLQVPGINVNLKGKNGYTALIHTTLRGHEGILRSLLESNGIDVAAEDGTGATALAWASIRGPERVTRLLFAASSPGVCCRALRWVAGEGNEGAVKLLIGFGGIDINGQDAMGRTPLIKASQSGHEGVIRVLLAVDGIDINARDGSGNTALIQASTMGHKAVVQLLLQSGGETAQELANRELALVGASTGGHEEVVRMLLTVGGVDLKAREQLWRTAWINASENGHDRIIRLFLELGGGDVDVQWLNFALVQACAQGHERVATILLRARGGGLHDVGTQQTALMRAAENGHQAAVRVLLESPWTKLDANAKNELGDTALIRASENGCTAVTELLLGVKGIDINLKGRDGYTALMRAYINGHKVIVALLFRMRDFDIDANAGFRTSSLNEMFNRIFTAMKARPDDSLNADRTERDDYDQDLHGAGKCGLGEAVAVRRTTPVDHLISGLPEDRQGKIIRLHDLFRLEFVLSSDFDFDSRLPMSSRYF
ncbi:ankyrin [Coprinopsis marcescibilis]|uniref:Ankyrin n=1 Tax=Coprinopsis marcescibilis TaxID=230819 RepID=A0A5C3KX73_COPMA|nr:ankyrin [Coprinopsis marcescibilis]